MATSVPLAARAPGTVWRRWWDQAWVQRVVVWGAIAVAWELFARRVGPFYFATPGATAVQLVRFFVSGEALVLLHSLQQMTLGFALAVAVGIPCGLAIGAYRTVEHVLDPYVRALFVTSMEALLPFLIILFGVGLELRIAVVFLFSVLYIVVNVSAGVKNIDRELILTARAFCATPFYVLRSVVLPATLPFVLAGLRLGLGHALKGMVIAELWVLAATGELLTNYGLFRQLDKLLALFVVLLALGALFTEGLFAVQRKVAPWFDSRAAG